MADKTFTEYNLTNSDESAAVSAIEVENALVYDAFHTSCSEGNVGTIKHILRACIDRNERLEFLHHSEQYSDMPSAVARGAFSTRGETGPPMFDAILADRPNIVALLLEEGYHINRPYRVDWFTPIMLSDTLSALGLACAAGNYEIAKLLVEKGASVNQKSREASPLLYASELEDPRLCRLLLQNGADACLPEWHRREDGVVIPLYKACMEANSETAEVILAHCEGHISLSQQVAYLRLLGAQCISRHESTKKGVYYWRKALSLHEQIEDQAPDSEQSSTAKSTCKHPTNDVRNNAAANEKDNRKMIFTSFRETYLDDLSLQDKSLPNADEKDYGWVASYDEKFILPFRRSCSSFIIPIPTVLYSSQLYADAKLCTNVAELDRIAKDEFLIRLQGLVVLENLLDLSTPNDLMVCTAVTDASDSGVGNKCKFLLYLCEYFICKERYSDIPEQIGQLVEFLLNAFTSRTKKQKFVETPDIITVLLASIQFTQIAFHAQYHTYVDHIPSKEEVVDQYTRDAVQSSMDNRLQNLTESLVALLCMFLSLDAPPAEHSSVQSLMRRLFVISRQATAVPISAEFELLKQAILPNYPVRYALDFYQTYLLPSIPLLEFLLECGIDINQQDEVGNTVLHSSILSEGNVRLSELLIKHGAHLDICNYKGVSCYNSLVQHPNFKQTVLFQGISLKCLAATTIMRFRIPFVGQVPKTLKDFISWHGIPYGKLKNTLKRSASDGDNHPGVV